MSFGDERKNFKEKAFFLIAIFGGVLKGVANDTFEVEVGCIDGNSESDFFVEVFLGC